MRYSLLLVIFICFSCTPKDALPITMELDSDWQFKKVSDSIWKSATVPGNVFSDLLKHQLIKDPFIGDNENDVQWISKTDWEYKTTFAIDKKTLQTKHIELIFAGLDTYASVYLNDSIILKANNAFRAWRVEVKSLLKPTNELRIVFETTSKQEEVEKEKLPYKLPEGERIFTRKAQFQYGWDWGPKLNTSGIWKPVKLVMWESFKIDDIYIKDLLLNDSIADLSIEINKRSNIELDRTLRYDIIVNDSLIKTSESAHRDYEQSIKIQIQNPRYWWPHNLGEPYLYDIKVVVKDDNKTLDSISVKHGLRTIALVTEKDSKGTSFYFKVNGVPVYAKGANYIPQSSFQNNVTMAHYDTLLNDVVDTNMNMLRVWGGGIYENDIFYDLCDEKGVLVWQDFMFACALYPGDNDFLQNVQKEAIDNVKRLRNHASIALWCGNNESSEGWYRWGWQAGRSEAEKAEIWNNYLKVFDSILPITVAQFTNTDYWESSPKFGRGNPKYRTEGDAHDWWVWHDGYPFDHLKDNIPRFMSEFGFQSYPSYETIRYINQSDTIELATSSFKNHQKHARGFQIIENYMKRDYPVPDSAEDYVYMSQLVQAHGIVLGFEAQRRAKPYNMGTLYWQLNDCWPAVSWSSIDYLGHWKALHFKTKKAFQDILLSSQVDNDSLKTWIINDKLYAMSGILSSKIIDFEGRVIWRNSQYVEVQPNSSTSKFSQDLDAISFDKQEVVLVTQFNEVVNHFYFDQPKNLKLQAAGIKQEIKPIADGFSIVLQSNTLQKDVFVYTNTSGRFSDNFFDILPNSTVEIKFVTTSKTLDDLQLKSFNTFIR